MENLWQKVKEHPWLSGAIVLGVFILVYLLVGGSSSTGVSTSSGNNNYAAEVAAATQLQEAQLAAQSQGNQANVALQAQIGQYQAAESIAQLQAQTDQANIAAQQAVAQSQIAASQQVADQQTQAQNYQSSIYGQVASNYLQAQQNITNINASTNAAELQNYFSTSLAASALSFASNPNVVGGTSLPYYGDFLQSFLKPITGSGSSTFQPYQGTPSSVNTATPTLPPIVPLNLNFGLPPTSGEPTGGMQVTN